MPILQPQADNNGPFGSAAALYREKGWLGTLPFREHTKWPPPPLFTGYNGHYPDDSQIERWLADPWRCRGNIGLWTGRIEIDGQAYELFGLDVDHYISGEREKRGGDSLAELEKKLGHSPKRRFPPRALTVSPESAGFSSQRG